MTCQLLKLPHHIFKDILMMVDHRDVFSLAMCSEEAANKVAFSGYAVRPLQVCMEVDSFYVNLSGIEDNDVKWVFDDMTRVTDPYMYKERHKVNGKIYHVEEEYFPDGLYDLNPVPVLYWQTKCQNRTEQFSAMKDTVAHLKSIFYLPIDFIRIELEEFSDFRALFQWETARTARNFTIDALEHGYTADVYEQLEYFMDTFHFGNLTICMEFEENFRYEKRITADWLNFKGPWCDIQTLLNADAPRVSFVRSKVSWTDLNRYLKLWQSGNTIPSVKLLSVNISNDFMTHSGRHDQLIDNKRKLVEDLEIEPMVRPLRLPPSFEKVELGYGTTDTEEFDLVRFTDGVRASVKINYYYAVFCVPDQ